MHCPPGQFVIHNDATCSSPVPCITVAIIRYLRIATEGKDVGQERVYESTWAHEDIFPKLDFLRMVVLLSVRRRGATHMDPRLDLYRSLCWRFVYVQSFCGEIESGLTGRAPNRDTQGHQTIR